MQQNSQRGPAAKRSEESFDNASTPNIPKTVLRAVILEEHPAIGAALEHLMLREGYEVEVCGESYSTVPGPALLLVEAKDRSGLYILKVRDVSSALDRLFEGELLEDPHAQTNGIRAFVPIPFGSKDVLRMVRAVGEFGTRERPGK